MKITIDIELTVDEAMKVCQNFTEKEKVADDVKIQKDTLVTTGLDGLNKVLKGLEDSKEYLENLTWEQNAIHKYMLWELLSNGIISLDEWRNRRLAVIENAWHLQRMKGLKDCPLNKKNHKLA